MTPILLPKHEHGSPAWHEARRARLGGSEIAAVLGLSPWQSPFSLWHLKAGLIEPDGDRLAMEWGRRLEPVIADKFCEEHPELIPAPAQGSAFVSSERPWQSASPEVDLYGPGPKYVDEVRTFCEVKTSARADAWYDGVPVYYRTQVLWTMDVLGVDHAYLAALIGGSDYREYLIELDDDAEADLTVMRTAGEQFMASIAANQPPDIDDSYATYHTVRRLTPDIELDTEVEVDRSVADTYLATKSAVDDAERAHRKARTDIARVMGRTQYATCEGVRIARRQPARDNGPAVLVSTRKQLKPALPTPKDNAA